MVTEVMAAAVLKVVEGIGQLSSIVGKSRASELVVREAAEDGRLAGECSPMRMSGRDSATAASQSTTSSLAFMRFCGWK